MTRRRRRRGGGRSVLLVVAALLAGSGLVRLGNGTGLAVAREIEALATDDRAPRDTAPPSGEVADCAPEPGVAALLADLQAREAQLAREEARHAERKRALEVVRKELTAQLAELERADADL